MHAKKIDQKSSEKLGELYQPDSLSSFIHSWQRILSSRGSKMNLRSDKEFESARKVLAARRKQLVKKGLGNKPCTTRSLTENEIDKLYDVQYFGLLNPVALQRNVWWVLTISFGFRGRDEARKLLFGDVILGYDADCEKQYLEWNVLRGSKTFSGEIASCRDKQRTFNPKIFETSGERCPINIYQEFVRHRPTDALKNDSPFFFDDDSIGKN